MSDTAVNVTAIAAAVSPFIVAVAGILIKMAVSGLAAEIKSWTGAQVDQAAINKIDGMITDEVGALVAAADDNLANAVIPVGSPIVAKIANKVVMMLPGELNDAGLSPSAVATKVAGAIGKLQAAMTRLPASPGVAPKA